LINFFRYLGITQQGDQLIGLSSRRNNKHDRLAADIFSF